MFFKSQYHFIYKLPAPPPTKSINSNSCYCYYCHTYYTTPDYYYPLTSHHSQPAADYTPPSYQTESVWEMGTRAHSYNTPHSLTTTSSVSGNHSTAPNTFLWVPDMHCTHHNSTSFPFMARVNVACRYSLNCMYGCMKGWDKSHICGSIHTYC